MKEVFSEPISLQKARCRLGKILMYLPMITALIFSVLTWSYPPIVNEVMEDTFPPEPFLRIFIYVTITSYLFLLPLCIGGLLLYKRKVSIWSLLFNACAIVWFGFVLFLFQVAFLFSLIGYSEPAFMEPRMMLVWAILPAFTLLAWLASLTKKY